MLMEALVKLAEAAGERIMAIYAGPVDVVTKDDQSPLTAADLASHECIVNGLRALTPRIPVLSEEGDTTSAERMSWTRYWLIDPLDGTKEFIKRNGEFTVNIALIDHGRPILGVVHAPALQLTYWGSLTEGAYKREGNGPATAIQVAPLPAAGASWRVVGSRSHATPEQERFLERLDPVDFVAMGSSLKLCLVAEGRADLYPRLGPTCEWDTAAAQAVVEAAGGQVLSWPGLEPLRCNGNPDSLLNPHFIVCPRPHAAWAGAPSAVVYEHRAHLSKSEIVWHRTQVDAVMRGRSLHQQACCLWLTGLSGAGKSTLANALELALHQEGRHTYLLDGDNVRHGLCRDLGMSEADRQENIRRVGEVAKLMVDAGLVVITAFISPFRADREAVRALFPADRFIEIHVDASLETCEARDPKGLYRKARQGLIREFTGIDSPYEAPAHPDIVLNTQEESVEACVSRVQTLLSQKHMR